MDAVADWANFLTLQVQTLTSQPSSALSIGLYAYSTFQTLLLYTYEIVNTITSGLLNFQNGRPTLSIDGKQSIDLVSVAFLLVILFLSLKLFDMVRRAIWSWIMFFVRLAFWVGILTAGVYVWSRGADGVWDDAKAGIDVYQTHREVWENYVDDVNRARREAVIG